MRISHAPKNEWLSAQSSSWRRHRMIWVLLFLVYGGSMLAAGAKLYKDDFFSSSVMPYLQGHWRWPLNKLKSTSAQPKRLVIDMKWDAYQKLSYQREQALQSSMLLAQSDDFVPAKITVDDRTVDVKMRLKGDNVDHLRGEKWSFRVSAKGDQTVWGMKQFSLHHPRARNWLFEWLGHRIMRREGVIGLRYEFVDMILNGKSLGIYAVEEHFEKHLVENNERREGPIVRFGESAMWAEINEQTRPFQGAMTSGSGDYFAAETDGFGTKSAQADPAAHALYLKAVHLLDLFRRRQLSTSQAFDTTKLATYFALIDMLGGEHGARWHNIRFYYNPVSSLLEPIAFDLNAGRSIRALSLFAWNASTHASPFPSRYDEFRRTLFDDKDFRLKYLAELDRVSDPPFLVETLKELDSDTQAALAILYTEFPYYEFSPQAWQKNQQYIKSMLHPIKGVHAYHVDSATEHIFLQIGNTQYLPLEIVGLEMAGKGLLKPTSSTTLEPRSLDKLVHYLTVAFVTSSSMVDVKASELTILYRVIGSREECRAPVAAHDWQWDAFLENDLLRQPPNPERFPFLQVNEKDHVIHIQPGKWEIAENMILPSGYTIQCGPATELNLGASAVVISHSPVQFIGTSEEPIVIRSSDGTGQGLAVLRAGRPSELEHVQFEGLTNPQQQGWVLTGAVTFYESPLSVSHCTFRGNTCEDALNCVRSPFTLEHCTFSDTKSDAFDADFSDGNINDCTFLRCRNDGVDVSGSIVNITNLVVTESGDKAVSCGEASRVEIRGLRATRTKIGLASKDASEVNARDVTLTECQYGLAAYQKKTEYGAPTLRVVNLKMERVSEPYLLEAGPTVSVDDRQIFGNRTDVKEIVYGPSKPAKPGQ
ncbi:MAG: CotH kinase family protein [Planctomycetota bacterium]